MAKAAIAKPPESGSESSLHDERYVGRGRLDRHLLESPQRGEQQHQAECIRVERDSFLTHAADFGVTWSA